VFPAKEQHIALYLQSIDNRLDPKSAAEEAVNAINWAHSLAGLDSPANSPFVQAVLQGIRSLLQARPEEETGHCRHAGRYGQKL